MTEFSIKSTQTDAILSFYEPMGEYFSVHMLSNECSGKVKVWAYTDSMGLAKLFRSLSNDWRGWSGIKKWSSIEGEFSITCTHDGLGHIALLIRLSHDSGNSDPWSLNAELVVEVAQLDSIASDAELFFQK